MAKIKCTVQCREYSSADYAYDGKDVVVLAFDGAYAICAVESLTDASVFFRKFDITHLVSNEKIL